MFLEIRKKGLVRLGMGLVAITLGPPIALASATGPTGFAVEPPHDPSGMVRIQDDGFVEYMKLVQTSLRTLGLYDGPIDGVSPDTGAAMRKYLELTGADVDGPVQFGGRDQTDLLNAAAAIYRRGDISVGGAIEKAPRLVEAWRLLDQADEMGKAGQKEQKAQYAKMALPLFTETLGDMSGETSWILSVVADSTMANGDYTYAEALYRRLAEANEQLFGSDKAQTLTAMAALGDAIAMQDRLADAEVVYRQVLARIERQDTLFASVTQNLAFVVHSQGRTNEAKALMSDLKD